MLPFDWKSWRIFANADNSHHKQKNWFSKYYPIMYPTWSSKYAFKRTQTLKPQSTSSISKSTQGKGFEILLQNSYSKDCLYHLHKQNEGIHLKTVQMRLDKLIISFLVCIAKIRSLYIFAVSWKNMVDKVDFLPA